MDLIHDQNMERNLSLFKKESDIFGLLFLGDAATISRIPLLNFFLNISVAVLEIVDCRGHLADGGEKDGTFICNRFLEHIIKLILTSQLQMLSGLMELQMFSLLVNCLMVTIQIFQLCVGLNTLYRYFSMMFPKFQL